MSATRSISTATTRDKLALVIGNNEYKARNYLKNSENDALDMATALRRIHFDVEERTNVTYSEMECLLNTFVQCIEQNDMVLLYFAGHGHQWEVGFFLVLVRKKR